jgi:hypothetical protein
MVDALPAPRRWYSLSLAALQRFQVGNVLALCLACHAGYDLDGTTLLSSIGSYVVEEWSVVMVGISSCGPHAICGVCLFF